MLPRPTVLIFIISLLIWIKLPPKKEFVPEKVSRLSTVDTSFDRVVVTEEPTIGDWK